MAHTDIKAMDLSALNNVTGLGTPFMDVKSAFNREALEMAGFVVWRL